MVPKYPVISNKANVAGSLTTCLSPTVYSISLETEKPSTTACFRVPAFFGHDAGSAPLWRVVVLEEPELCFVGLPAQFPQPRYDHPDGR